MSFGLIRDALIEFTPALDGDVDWARQSAMLVVLFTNENSSDIHLDHADHRKGSKQTHISLTSGGDLETGLSPVDDFFPGLAAPGAGAMTSQRFRARLHDANLRRLGAVAPPDGLTTDLLFQFIRRKNLNKQEDLRGDLTEKADLAPLRPLLGVGTVLVLLRGDDGVYTCVGANTTDAIRGAMTVGGKFERKRMFVPASEGFVLPDVPDRYDAHAPDPGDQADDGARRRLLADRLRDPDRAPAQRQHWSDGYVYLVKNLAFSGWVKVGKTIQPWDLRLSGYQTSAPLEFPYEMPVRRYVSDCHVAESRV